MFSIKAARYTVFGFTFLLHLVLTLTLSGDSPTGIDGYYYLKQIETIAQTGQFYFQDHSLAFFPPAFLTFIFPTQSIFILQLSTSLCYAFTLTALFISIHFIVIATGGSESRNKIIYYPLTVVVMVWLTLPFHHFAFTYYKNLFAITLLLWAICFYFQSIEGSQQSKKSVYLSIFLVVLAMFSHKSVFALLTLFLISYVLHQFSIKRFMQLIAVLAGLLALFFLVFARGSAYLLEIIKTFHFQTNFLNWFGNSLRHDKFVIVIYLLCVTIILVYFFVRNKIPTEYKTYTFAVMLFLGITTFPFQKFGYNETSFRFLVLTPLFILPTLVLFVQTTKTKIKYFRLTLPGLLVVFTGFFLLEVGRIQLNFLDWKQLSNIEKISQHVSHKDHLIAHHGLEYYVNYITGIRARQWKSADEQQQKFRIAFVPNRVMDKHNRKLFATKALLKLNEEYYLVTEEYWQYYRKNYFLVGSWKNPEMQRPPHLHE
ncbi:MAG: hypothetical protein ABUK01_05145 [Leptospirales bacterium]